MDDASPEIVDQDATVTGRVPGTMGGMSFDDIGPGLFEITGAMELKREPSWARHQAETLGFAARRAEDRQEQSVKVLLRLRGSVAEIRMERTPSTRGRDILVPQYFFRIPAQRRPARSTSTWRPSPRWPWPGG
jgi:hypothetical protein